MKRTKNILIIILLTVVFYTNNVYAGCKLGPNVMLDLAGLYNVLKIMVPLVIIALTVYEIFNTVLKGDAEGDIKKVAIKFVKRIAIAILILFTPMLVNQFMKMLSINDGEGSTCFEYLMNPDKIIEDKNLVDDSKYNTSASFGIGDTITIAGQNFIITDTEGSFEDATGITYYALAQENFETTCDTVYKFNNGGLNDVLNGIGDVYEVKTQCGTSPESNTELGKTFSENSVLENLSTNSFGSGLALVSFAEGTIALHDTISYDYCQKAISNYADYLRNYKGFTVISPDSNRVEKSVYNSIKGGGFWEFSNGGFVTLADSRAAYKQMHLYDGNSESKLDGALVGAEALLNGNTTPNGDFVVYSKAGFYYDKGIYKSYFENKKNIGIDLDIVITLEEQYTVGCRPMIEFTEKDYQDLINK